VLAVVDHEVVAIATNVRQGPLGNLVGGKHSRRVVPQADGSAVGKFGN
jgi:hypothetical protein